MIDLALVALVLAIPTGLLMLRRGVKQPQPWHQQFTALLGAALISGSLTVVVWGFGVFSGGLDVRETCELSLHTTYDQEWRETTGSDGKSFFPLANACNEHVSLLPAWVNPTIVVLAVLTTGFFALALFRIAASIRHRKELASP